MKRLVASACGFWLLLAACQRTTEPSPAELVALYRVVLDSVVVHLEFPQAVAVHPETFGDRPDWEPEGEFDPGPWVSERFPTLEENTWADFVRQNQTSTVVAPDVVAEIGYPMARDPWDEDDPAQRNAEFRRLQAELGEPFTVVRLSQPGFAEDGQQAIVHISSRCSLLMCGAGWYVLAERRSGTWVVTDLMESWIE